MWTDRARVLDDPTPGSWLLDALTGPPGTVAGTVPGGYGAYARILHRVDGSGTTWAQVAATTGRSLHPLAQWHALIGAADPYARDSDLWSAGDPELGNLALPQLHALCDILGRHTTTPRDCYFAMWEGWGSHNGGSVRMTVRDDGTATSEDLPPLYSAAEWASPRLHLPWRDYLLLSGPLAAIGPITRYDPSMPYATQTPSLVWPADHAWILGTEIDFDSTLLAATTEAVAAVLAHPDLEAFPVRPGDSLRADADHLNP